MRLVILVICALVVLGLWQHNRVPEKDIVNPPTAQQTETDENSAQEAKKDQPTAPLSKPLAQSPDQGDQVPDTVDTTNTVINIGEYIDVDAIPADDGREPINIGEYIDPDAVPVDDGRPPINIGEYIGDPDDPTYLNQQYQEPISIGDYLPPPGEYDRDALGEYTEPVNIGEPIYIDEDMGPQNY